MSSSINNKHKIGRGDFSSVFGLLIQLGRTNFVISQHPKCWKKYIIIDFPYRLYYKHYRSWKSLPISIPTSNWQTTHSGQRGSTPTPYEGLDHSPQSYTVPQFGPEGGQRQLFRLCLIDGRRKVKFEWQLSIKTEIFLFFLDWQLLQIYSYVIILLLVKPFSRCLPAESSCFLVRFLLWAYSSKKW